MIGIDALLASLPTWTLVGGKGGVGKTTCAAALGVRSARGGVPTLVLSTDPAGTLADALGAPLAADPRAVTGVPSLAAAQLDAAAGRADFVSRFGDVVATIIDRGTYLDREDIRGLVDSTLPGIDETMALLALAELPGRNDWTRVLLDTAPTGHTLRLLGLPQTFLALVDLLDAMQGKHRFMVSALLHHYRPDAADAFIDDLRAKVMRLRDLTTDPTRAAVVLVARPEPLVLGETVRYAATLAEMDMTVRAVVLNVIGGTRDPEAEAAIEAVRRGVPDATLFGVDDCGVLEPGVPGLERWGRRVRQLSRDRRPRSAGSRARETPAPRTTLAALPAAPPALDSLPPVIVVGGKGGVGKTTVACALALAAARRGHRTLLVSTDPAPSVADALAQPIANADVQVRAGYGLVARQIDATAAFSRWRTEYESRVDSAFDALLGPGLDAAHDRAIARRLFALAPPGIDELYALIWLGDALAEGMYERIVIDPAPTGHLIRLLEMPSLALDWSHRLLRLMLKYRELAGGGELAAELVAFARRTRAVRALLQDATQAG
ncbi:MAG TPA: ArsA family ATPase, partial [Gemmatimonadaceae bacterium]|nr:ArsA family ATPase [Gemmatimonadaceae bacterium]